MTPCRLGKMIDERAKGLARRCVDLEGSPVVEGGRPAVDDREAASLEWKPCDGPDLERRSDDEQECRRAGEFRGPLQRSGRKELAEECDARLEHGLAVWAERRGALLELCEHRLGALGPETVEALCEANGAVHLDDSAAAGARVERVDVLCDDRGDEASPLELGERPVCHVRFCVEEQVDPPAVEVPHPLGIAPKGLNGRDFEGVDVGPDPGR